jgi:hypothetical protein
MMNPQRLKSASALPGLQNRTGCRASIAQLAVKHFYAKGIIVAKRICLGEDSLGCLRMVREVKRHRAFRSVLAAISGALAFLLLAHISTCLPCYDDDVCASARIDTAQHSSFDQTLDQSDAKLKHKAVPGLPLYVHMAYVAVHLLPERLPAPVQHTSADRLEATGNTSLAHRRVTVLLI